MRADGRTSAYHSQTCLRPGCGFRSTKIDSACKPRLGHILEEQVSKHPFAHAAANISRIELAAQQMSHDGDRQISLGGFQLSRIHQFHWKMMIASAILLVVFVKDNPIQQLMI